MVHIRRAELKDAGSLAQIHMKALGYTFLGRLGLRFLRDIHYPNILTFPNALTLLAEENEQTIGFVTFAYNGAEFEAHLTSNRMRLLPYLTVAALKSPWIAKDVLAMLIGSNISFIQGWDDSCFKNNELFTISVDPTAQSSGIGSKLITAGMNELHKINGTPTIRCFVKTDTDRAERFYMRNGFQKIGSEVRGKTRFSILIK